MKRYFKARDYIYSNYHEIYNPVLQMNAFCHTSAVDSFITLLAISRGVDVELAKICAVFHDFARFVDNCSNREHARLSSLHAHRFLTSTKEFTIDEIDQICFAISDHSNKEEVTTPLAEVLKDADILAHFGDDPTRAFKGIVQKRLIQAFEEIQS